MKHIAGFISGIWQIHAFGEGNTRTTAVFAIKYLRSFGFDIDNDLFEKHSWYFNLSKGITADVSKSQFDTLNCSLEKLAILKAVGENLHITQEAFKTTFGKSISTVKRLTINLQKKGFLVRKNGKRDGYWEVLS